MLLYGIVVYLLISVQESLQWRGHYDSYTVIAGHRYVEWCDYHCWWQCCSHSHRTETIYGTRYQCQSMWTHNGDQNCNIPLCTPSCGSGKCIVKNGVHACDCPDGRTGPSCAQYDCSYQHPCYPGQCQGGSRIICNCQQGFTDNSCRHMPNSWKATILNIQARMSFWKRGTRNPKEEYGLEIDSTEKTTTKWTNMKRFNWLNVSATAMVNSQTPPRPSYVKDARFGIVDAKVHIKLQKITAGPLGAVLEEKSVVCNNGVTDTSPVDVAKCELSKPNFDYLLGNRDKLTLEVAVTTGGFRKLIDRKTWADKGTETYYGKEATASVAYRFDFDPPKFTGTKSEAFHTNNDFTKAPINLRWSGWTDDISGMERYTWEYFRLEPNGDGDLREVNKMRPVDHKGVKHTDPIVYPLPIKPSQPGMYSFVLEAVDKANNSVYMRRCILYDPESSVTTDNKHGIYLSSAHQDGNGHQWLTKASTSVVATWTDHFLNYAHEKEKYLNRILEMSIPLVPDENIYKRVEKRLDDYEGDRTVNAVSNLRGIVKFQTAHAVNKSGGKIQSDPFDWKDELNLTTSVSFKAANATSGSTLTFWVRAIDAMGNKKVDSTSATFDFSQPSVAKLELQKNKPSRIPFSSKLHVPSVDHESGIDYVEVKVTQISDGHLLTNRSLSVQSIQPTDCTNKITDCYCPQALSVCYKRINILDVSNCWLMVSKNSLKTAEVRLEVGVVNGAGLMTSKSITITDLMSLNGTEAYFGPMNVKADTISQSGVRVTWHHAPSCYPRTFIWLSYDDSGKMIKIFKDAESYDLTGLEPGRQYKVQVLTDYGGIKSKPVQITFNTLEAPGIGAGAIAGIVIGILLIITVLAVGFFLWRTGKVAAMIRRHRSRYGRSTRIGQRSQGQHVVNNVLQPKNSNTKLGMIAYKNKAYAIDDDIYIYGSMEFTSEQPWYIAKNNLTLLEEINTGRFARIYKASYRGENPRDVAAKMLKDQQSEENLLLMMAKINFAATQVGEHRNVLGFVGAVLDNDALGPVLVMEYCENGQLDNWLTSRRSRVEIDVLEKIQTFALQVARGMEYLAKKGIAHRKLAARNCLLTFVNEVKVAGFGPSRMDENNEEDNARGDRIPVKWTAPECLKSMKGANEKSDMWSYGVTLWEIFSMGQSPYPNIRSRDLPVKIQNGHRLGRPEYAEDIHYDLMKSCWHEKPEQRPTFTMTVDKLEQSFGLRPTSGEVYYYSK